MSFQRNAAVNMTSNEFSLEILKIFSCSNSLRLVTSRLDKYLKIQLKNFKLLQKSDLKEVYVITFLNNLG